MFANCWGDSLSLRVPEGSGRLLTGHGAVGRDVVSYHKIAVDGVMGGVTYEHGVRQPRGRLKQTLCGVAGGREGLLLVAVACLGVCGEGGGGAYTPCSRNRPRVDVSSVA